MKCHLFWRKTLAVALLGCSLLTSTASAEEGQAMPVNTTSDGSSAPPPDSQSPSSSPSFPPTMLPVSAAPTSSPTSSPSAEPSSAPSNSTEPSATPTSVPSGVPSVSAEPSKTPTSAPSDVPSISTEPTTSPTAQPSSLPSTSASPSAHPIYQPSSSPSTSASPSAYPTVKLEGLTVRTSEFEAVEDTYVEMGSNVTFGNSSELAVAGNPKRITLIKFDISALNGGTDEEPATVFDAKLRLRSLRDRDFGGSVSVYYDLDFDEQSADWDSDGEAPLSESYYVGDIGKVSENEDYILDIKNAFRKKPLPSTFSIRITSDSEGVRYRSREGPNGVSLERFGPKAIFSFAYEPTTHTLLADKFGTDSPTLSPTITTTWIDNDIPTDPSEYYFNYDPNSDYGPPNWSKVKGRGDFDSFQNLKTDIGRNSYKCDSGVRQSPRDVCDGQYKTGCEEFHQMRRSSRGDFGFDPSVIDTPKAEIKSNLLRLVFPERRGWDEGSSRPKPDVPRMDFAHNGFGSGEQPLIHLDVKTKSEHLICGTQYDVELQYFYLHQYGNLEVLAILGEVVPDGKDNPSFQKILDFFQKKADQDHAQCNARKRRARALFLRAKAPEDKDEGESDSLNEPIKSSLLYGSDSEVIEHDASKSTGLYHRIITRLLNIVKHRELLNANVFDFYHSKDLLRTEWYIGYMGSLTYPPCAEETNWRIADVPFKLSYRQLRQLRNIQFKHQDPNTCKFNSVHYNLSNARPVKKYKGGKYYRCTRRNYVSDRERKDSGNRYGFSSRNNWQGSDGEPFITPFPGISAT